MAFSAHKTVPTAGTAVALGTERIDGPLMVKALDSNTDVVALGNDGANAVALSNGLRLEAGEVVVFQWVGSLEHLWLDAAVNGEGVCWLRLNV